MIPVPPIDGRRVESFFQELKRYAPHYTPDLKISDEQGVGVALMRIFAQLAEIIAVRLDQAPQKHFVAYLDRLGISLLPARPARAAVTFRVVSGFPESVLVPTGTQVTAPGKEDEIPFETTQELRAIPGILTAAYGTDPLQDKIYGPPPDFLKQVPRQPSELGYKIRSLVSQNSDRLQLDDNKELEPGSFVLIGCSEKRIVLKKDEGGFVTLSEPVSQAFPPDTSVLPIRDFEIFNGIDVQQHVLYLGHDALFTVTNEVEISLKFKLKDGDDTGLKTALNPLELAWEFWTKNEAVRKEEFWQELTVKSDRTLGLSSNGTIVLTKPGGLEIVPQKIEGNQNRWIRARVKKDGPQVTTINNQRKLPEVDTIEIDVKTGTGPSGTGMKADQGFYNAIPLDVQIKPEIGFFPFGTEPRQFDQFYIASKEAFSKEDARVALDFKLDLQTLAGPAVVNFASGNATDLRVYSIGLRRRLFEFDVNGGGFKVLGSPLDNSIPDPKGSRFVPVEDSAPAVVKIATGAVFAFVRTEDLLDQNQKKSARIWVRSVADNSVWIDLERPNINETSLQFDPAAVVLTGWAGAQLAAVFVVAGDSKLYLRTIAKDGTAQSGWVLVAGQADNSDLTWNSAPFITVDGATLLLFITNKQGTVYQLTLEPNLAATWTPLTPLTPFTAVSRPFAQTIAGTKQAKVFVVSAGEDGAKPKLFEWSKTSSAATFDWINLGNPQSDGAEIGLASAPHGYLEHPDLPVDKESKHIFVRSEKNRLWERLDHQWQEHDRANDPELRDSPVVYPDETAITATPRKITLHVFAASNRNSLVTWSFDLLSEGNKVVDLQGVVLNRDEASPEDNHYVSNDRHLLIEPETGPTIRKSIRAYDGTLRLLRVDPPALNALPDQDSMLIIKKGVDVDYAHAAGTGMKYPLTIASPDSHKTNPVSVKVNDQFLDPTFYSRVTGMILVNQKPAAATFTYELDLEQLLAKTEFSPIDDTGAVPELSWEYWNGRGWVSLKITDNSRNLLTNGEVVIDSLPKIEPTEVAGQENYWIRARLVGGDYGQVTFKVEGNPPILVPIKSTLRPPKISDLSISYKAQPVAPEACLTFNNLDCIDQTAACQTEGSHFPPFEPLEDSSLTFFFGFDKTFSTGPIRFLLDAAERNFDEGNAPEFEWSFRRDRQWKKLNAEDGSAGLTRQGILSISASEDLTREKRFGQSLFWIKGSLRSDRNGNGTEAAVAAATPETAPQAEVSCSCSCSAESSSSAGAASQDQPNSASQAVLATALLRGVFLNTVWATQGETITEEIIGSGDGEQNQTHNFQHGNVLEGEDVRVRELLSAEERERIIRELGNESVTDREDLGGAWVRWKEAKSLFDSGPQDRCYEIDRAAGVLRFGDGTHGYIPPAGVDNIRAFKYQSGGGTVGNVAANAIQTLATAVDGIESVFNPTAAGGGSDKADTNAMLTIGPRQISHLDRAVSVGDFEELALEASPQIAKVRCLATTNLKPNGVAKPNPCDPAQLHEAVEERARVSLIIVPDSNELRPCPSLELRRSVKKYLSDRAPSAIAAGERIVVQPPDYVAVDVEAEIFVTTLDQASTAERAARNKLTQFLHPLHGGPDGKGWDFGRPITKSDVFAVLERIPEIDRVENLEFRFRSQTSSDRVEVGPNQLLASGEHTLKIRKA